MSGFVSVRIEIHGVLLTDPHTLLKKARLILDQELHVAGLFLQGKVQRATPVGVSGTLRKGWFVERQGDGLYVLSNPAEYGLAVEKGRKAAYVPIKPLALWVRRKLGLPAKKALGVAIAISKKKKLHATPGQHFAEQAVFGNVEAATRLLARTVGARLIAEANRETA